MEQEELIQRIRNGFRIRLQLASWVPPSLENRLVRAFDHAVEDALDRPVWVEEVRPKGDPDDPEREEEG